MLHSRIAPTILMAAFALISGRFAFAQDGYYSTGTYTIDAAHSVNTAYVGFDSGGHTTDGMGNPYNPTVNLVPGGSVHNDIFSVGNSQVNIEGGFADSIISNGSSQFTFSSGLVNDFADLRGNTRFNLYGGTITNRLQGNDTTLINVYGGTVNGSVLAYNNGQVNIYGGTINGGLETQNQSDVTIYGGTFGLYSGYNFVLYTNGVGNLTLVGYNLRADNLGTDPSGGTDYALSGTLQDGTDLAGYTLQDNTGGGHFTLQAAPVPEPGRVAMCVGLVTVGAGFVRKRRARA